VPRKPRIEVEDGVYHVYNRVASGERLLANPEVAVDFIERIRSIKERDGWTLFAWCVMANHFHLAVRRSTVDLATSLHALQGIFSRIFNQPRSRSGGLWQSRYQARLIDAQRYLSQVVLYIHLNPVRAGVVDDPLSYPYSGHQEIVHRVRRPLVDVDDALLCWDGIQRW
jgi:REP element-mobilizing transposase RayT